jgi:antitoxin Phd
MTSLTSQENDMGSWQLQTAKARLSEVIKKASHEGPQIITQHGAPSAVILSNDDYEKLKEPRGSFVEFMRKSPLLGIEIDLKRERSSSRKTDIS